MKRVLSSVLVLGLAFAMTSTASASGRGIRVGNFINHNNHRPVVHVQPRVAHYCPPAYCPPVHYCYQVHYILNCWHSRSFHCELDARNFSAYLCSFGFETRIVCEGGCFFVHYYLPHCLTRSFDHRCDADALASLLCSYGVQAHVVVVRH